MRFFNGCFIVLFMTMLSLPLVFVDLSSDRVSVEENRMLAERPRLADMRSRPGAFVRDFDAWFKDSTGFREWLIKLYKTIDKNKWLNNRDVRYTDGKYVFLIGEQGHHYYAGSAVDLIPKFQGKQFLSDEQLADTAGKLEDGRTYLDRKGIPLVVMFCADKESVYPEFYPKEIKRGPEPIQLEMITGYIKKHANVDVFNIRQALLAEKDNYALYNVSSGDLYHYNEMGAFFAYRELMNHINTYFPGMVPYELDDIDVSYDEKGIPYVSFKNEMTYKKLEASFFDGVELNRPFTWENEAYENIDPNMPVILFLRDSYASFDYGGREMLFIGKYIARHFSKTILIHYSNMNRLDEYITCYKPDIVVFESAERSLRSFADYVAGIPELP
jgi:hypothetical protein